MKGSEVATLRGGDALPQSVEAEQAVLGALLCQNELLDRVTDLLGVEHFFDPVHARIFAAVSSRVTKGHLASPVTLATVLDTDAGLKELGGGQYLVRMAAASIGPSAIRAYAETIVEMAVRRRLLAAAEKVKSDLAAGEDAGVVSAALLSDIHSIPDRVGGESSVSILKAMVKAAKEAQDSFQGTSSYLRTGIDALDRILKGLGPGDYMLLGGATSMGKTSVALEIARQVSGVQNLPVAFWSLEMSAEQLATRLASALSQVPYAELRDAASMEDAEFLKWMRATPEVGKMNLRIIPKHIRDLAAGYAAISRAKREAGGLALIVVDYAQLVRGTGKSRFEQMTEVSIGLKHMAGLMGCPVVALVQLSRDIGGRDDKRPHLFDIKETGQFENDADQAVFCHREGYWLERQGPKADKSGHVSDQARMEWEADCKASKNALELIVRKNRHGRLASAKVGFHDATNRFWSLDGNQDRLENDGEGFL